MSTPERTQRHVDDVAWIVDPLCMGVGSMKPARDKARQILDLVEAAHEAALVEARTQEREKIADWLEGEARRKGLKPIAVALRLAAAIRSAEWVRSGGPE